MDYLAFLPPAPLGWTEHEAVTLTPAIHDPAAPAAIRLGAFAADGSFLDGFRILRNRAASQVEPPPETVEDHLAGTWIYGGVINPHYGHFLVETLSRAWLLRRRADLPVLWHAANKRDVLPAWYREILAMLGIPEERCRTVRRPTSVERIVLPDAGCVIERWLDPQQARALAVFPFAEFPRRGRRVWLSRSRLPEGFARVEGEAEMEACLAEAGWTVIHPETLPVWQQLAAMAEAEEIAGFEGSAFHTLLLARDVRARVTLYRRSKDRPPVTHAMIAAAKHLRQAVRELPLRLVKDGFRQSLAVLDDPAAAARIVDPACRTRPVPARRPEPVPAAEMRARKLAFVHVPKTAGTSFTQALMAGWPRARVVATQDQFDAVTDEEMAGLDLIAGHFRAHRLEERGLPGFDAVTVLRDPFARLLSAYHFSRKTIELGLEGDEAMQLAARTGFGEWAFSPFGRVQQHSQLYILGLNAGDRPRLVPLATLLEQARARLDGMLVGTVDHLAEFTGFVFRRYGHAAPPPLGRAMAGERQGPEDGGLTAAQRQELMEALRPDYELYAYGRDLMLRRLEAEQKRAA